MTASEMASILVERKEVYSADLKRSITIDFYLPKNIQEPSGLSLLLINDGQDLLKMDFAGMLDTLIGTRQVSPLLCVGIHAGEERKLEYGTAGVPDYMNRGSKAGDYTAFIVDQLLPYIERTYHISSFRDKGFAGFSLGGLTAFDIAWTYPHIFSIAGVFSGSLWWRTRDLAKGYVEETDRIMHAKVREGNWHEGNRFYFTTGSLDETADRNNNGIIDSIDDTLSLIEELKAKGYTDSEIQYVNYDDGKHDVETWGRALPAFLRWAWPVRAFSTT